MASIEQDGIQDVEITPHPEESNDIFEVKQPKPKQTDEEKKAARKKQMLDNLARGRQRALENRKKKKMLKDLEKKEKQEKLDTEYNEKVVKKQATTPITPKNADNDVIKELMMLKDEIKTLRMAKKAEPAKQAEPAKKAEPTKKAEPVKQIEPVRKTEAVSVMPDYEYTAMPVGAFNNFRW